MQTCRYGVSYEISSRQISKKVVFLRSMCIFLCFFLVLLGKMCFWMVFLLFSLLLGHLCGFQTPPFLQALQNTHHVYIYLWARGALVCLQINRRPAEHCSGQIWRGVVSDVILIPTLFLHVLENCHVAPVDCDMGLHRNSTVICWA